MSYGQMFPLLPGEVVEDMDQQDQRERLTFPLAHKGHDLGRSLPISFFWTTLVFSHGADVVMSIQQSPSLPLGAVLRNFTYPLQSHRVGAPSCSQGIGFWSLPFQWETPHHRFTAKGIQVPKVR